MFPDVLISGVLCHQLVGISLCLRNREEQTFLSDTRLADRLQELHGIVAMLQAYHVKPAMALKRQFNTTFVYDLFAHSFLRQSTHSRQSGTMTDDVKRLGCLSSLALLVESLSLHKQHIGIAIHHEVGRIGVIFR